MRAPRHLRPRVTLAVLAVGAATLASCPKPTQYGGPIAIDHAGLAARVEQFCRWRHGDPSAPGPCAEAASAPAPAPAHVHKLAAGEGLGGPIAMGRPGDFLLANDEVAFVIGQIGSGVGFNESGGMILDAADARENKDELGMVFSTLGEFPRQPAWAEIASGTEDGGRAFVALSGHDLWSADVLVTTRYVLAPGSRALEMTTVVTNRGAEPSAGVAPGDAIGWGETMKLAPGKGIGFRGPSKTRWVGGVGRFTGYAYVPAEGDLDAMSGGGWTDGHVRPPVTLAPGASVSYVRSLAVGVRGDTASVESEALVLAGGQPGAVEVEIVDEDGAPVGAHDGTKIFLAPGGGRTPFVIRVGTNAPPEGGEVPPGKYDVSIEGEGVVSTAPAPVVVRSGVVSKTRVVVEDEPRLAVTIWEPGGQLVPAKLTISRIDSDTPLDLGPANVAGPASNTVQTKDGRVDLHLPAGKYHLVASRGPEYDLAEADVELKKGWLSGGVDLTVKRVVDTSGFLACDFHQHASRSIDASVADADRVVSNVVEGVEVAVASEHNALVDFAPLVEKLGLASRLRCITGDELSTDTSKDGFGHANVFPLAPTAVDLRGGAPRVRDRLAAEVFDELRALPGKRVIQVNHPRSGKTGYFDLYGLDPKTGVGTHAGYDARFDALEVWNGRNVDARTRVLADWFTLLRTGHPTTPTASTDTHGIVGHEAGYPRTYVGVKDDDPARLDVDDLVDAVDHRRSVVLTNGPFVTLRAGDVSMGGLARAKNGKIALAIHVERAPWVDATEAQLVVGGEAQPAVPLEGKRRSKAGAVVDDLTLAASTKVDTWVVAIVRGQKPLTPVLAGDPKEITPFAVTAPIWIDADGDGAALGRRARD